jgi:cytochrome bd ubiquinol oxidase subunit II
MVETWFALLAFTLVVFAVLDGWNIGAGLVHFAVATTARERREAMAALGPFWSWHEVWLIAAGGTFLLAFPRAMGIAFSGFYLALWLAVWSFILRGIAIEVAAHLDDTLWQSAWDFTFAAASLLLALVFGVALGNVIRGVPLDAGGSFSLSFFTDFRVTGRVGLFDWYTVSVAGFTAVLLAAHGATYLAFAADGPLKMRSARWARGLWLATLALFLPITIATWIVRPELFEAMRIRPLAWLAGAAALAGAWMLWTAWRGHNHIRGLAGSSAVIAGLLSATAASVFPIMLRSTLAPEHSLTAYAGAAPAHGLSLALLWWPAAAVLSFAYVAVVMRGYRQRPSTRANGASL